MIIALLFTPEKKNEIIFSDLNGTGQEKEAVSHGQRENGAKRWRRMAPTRTAQSRGSPFFAREISKKFDRIFNYS